MQDHVHVQPRLPVYLRPHCAVPFLLILALPGLPRRRIGCDSVLCTPPDTIEEATAVFPRVDALLCPRSNSIRDREDLTGFKFKRLWTRIWGLGFGSPGGAVVYCILYIGCWILCNVVGHLEKPRGANDVGVLPGVPRRGGYAPLGPLLHLSRVGNRRR